MGLAILSNGWIPFRPRGWIGALEFVLSAGGLSTHAASKSTKIQPSRQLHFQMVIVRCMAFNRLEFVQDDSKTTVKWQKATVYALANARGTHSLQTAVGLSNPKQCAPGCREACSKKPRHVSMSQCRVEINHLPVLRRSDSFG